MLAFLNVPGISGIRSMILWDHGHKDHEHCLPEKKKKYFPLWNPEMSALFYSRELWNSGQQYLKRIAQRGIQRDNSLPCVVWMICGSSSNRLFLFILSHQELTCTNLPFIAIKGDTILLLHVCITHFPQPRFLFQNLWRLTQCQMGTWGKSEVIYLFIYLLKILFTEQFKPHK